MMEAQVQHQGVLADGQAARLRSRTGTAWSVLPGWWSSLLAGISLYFLLYCPLLLPLNSLLFSAGGERLQRCLVLEWL